MSRVYIYVVDRDFGFAPNPFHGYCSLATCKPGIRRHAGVGDWVIGIGGARLNATGKCIFAMQISEKLTFNEYWSNPTYYDKKPVRNGSQKMLVGDNIYCYDTAAKRWLQADSHHSHADGSVNVHNLAVDTKTDQILLSHYFFYFGKEAPVIPSHILNSLGYKNGRNYRVFDEARSVPLIEWLRSSFRDSINVVNADPFDFHRSEKRYSVKDNKIS
jgi:hypothetical protein